MKISYSKNFVRQTKELNPDRKQSLYQVIELFEQNPLHASLRNHSLKGRYKAYRSIDIEPDLQALYIQKNNEEVVFIAAGSHAQLYD